VNLSSQMLRVAFKGEAAAPEEAEEQGPLEVQASGDVVVDTAEPEGTLRGDEFIYDSKNKMSTIRGNPAEFSWPSDVATPDGKKQNILHASTIRFETDQGNAYAEGPGELIFYTRQEFTPKMPSPGEAVVPLDKEIPTQVKISWKEKAAFQDNFNHLAFFKDVEIVRGTMIIRAQKFVITLEEAENAEGGLPQASAGNEAQAKNQELESPGNNLLRKEKTAIIEGEPLVEARFDTSVIRSQSIRWDEQNQLLKAGPGEFSTVKKIKNAEGKELPPEITDVRWKGQMLYDQDKGEALFSKDAELVGPEGVIKADTLKMVFEKKSNALMWLVAEGNVIAEERERKARCDKLFWDAWRRIAKLTGTPAVEIWQGENRALWQEVFYYADENRISGTGGAYVSTIPE
jgi:lipopolysaccharide export system protein LptA